MKIVIDIPEEEYKEIMADISKGSSFEDMMTNAIKNGTPLIGTIIIDDDGDMHKVYKENKE